MPEQEKDKKEGVEELAKTTGALLNLLEDTEEARRQAETERDKTLSIITNFTDGLLLFNQENKLSLINPRAEKFLNVKTQHLIGKSVSELRLISTLEPLAKILGNTIKKIFRKELELKGNLILEVSTIPVLKGGKKTGDLVILHDITREKIIEQMKTEFVSISAHQLRTPLSAIKWTLRMLLDGDLGKITKEQREFIEKTYQSNERMINLINELLNVTRIEEGRYLSKPVLASIEDITQSIIDSYRDEIKNRGLEFAFKKPQRKLPKVSVDTEKIKLAIQNLIDNSVRYTARKGKITISLKRTKKDIEFSIKDTGVGIPKHQENRVFTKFFRAENVIRMDTEGSGLGLFITKNIIEAHGGKIWFESKEGKGTAFYFILPL